MLSLHRAPVYTHCCPCIYSINCTSVARDEILHIYCTRWTRTAFPFWSRSPLPALPAERPVSFRYANICRSWIEPGWNGMGREIEPHSLFWEATGETVEAERDRNPFASVTERFRGRSTSFPFTHTYICMQKLQNERHSHTQDLIKRTDNEWSMFIKMRGYVRALNRRMCMGVGIIVYI